MNPKKIAAEKAVDFINDGMTVGLGTGSTAYWAIKKIGERVRQGLKIHAMASSSASEELAMGLNIPIIDAGKINHIDITIDGADEVDQFGNLIKGGGGALMREKILAAYSKRFYVVVDQSKLVKTLGKFPLPIEILAFGAEITLNNLRALKGNPKIRKEGGKNFVTDNGNLIADCSFLRIEDPETVHHQINAIPGVLETGLFFKTMVHAVVVGLEHDEVKVIEKNDDGNFSALLDFSR
ncbi:MAG TPA: ribose-5-phosphate isomerase RpiA [Ohtaekwangia sp.]|nr:ribose-5-phosphate isomerase RpiA [Ohtaekwangia sp.]